MTRLTPAQIADVAYGAGFRGKALTNAVAVALAESGGNPRAVGHNSDKYRSRDRGLWQINSHWHPEVSDAAAFSPSSCAAAAYRISSHGKDWSPWSTWKNGSAGAQLGRARLASAHATNHKGKGTKAGGQVNAPGTSPTITIIGVNGTKTVPNDGHSYKGLGVGGGSGGHGSSATAAAWSLPDPLDPFAGAKLLAHLSLNPVESASTAIKLGIKAGAWLADSHNWLRIVMVSGGSLGVLISLGMIAKSGAPSSTAGGIVTKPLHAAASAAAAVATDGASLVATKALKSTK